MFWIVWLVFSALVTVLWRLRIKAVYKYHRKMIHAIGVASMDDIIHERDFQWRFDAHDQVDFDSMVFQFWRRLDSFYPDKSFMECTITTDYDLSELKKLMG